MKYKYNIVYTTRFKRNLKKILKQGKDIEKLKPIVDILAAKEILDPKYKEHPLYNDKRYQNCRDCHIEPDWVLIYRYLEKDLVLLLVNTGSHSEILDA